MIALSIQVYAHNIDGSVNTILYSKKLVSIKLLQVWLDKNIVILSAVSKLLPLSTQSFSGAA
ncbi:hypothetical protein QNH26_06625 [Peribacillus frigoritolerans]|uniref:hypothetical protein n=1 Tax=Peribacillus frigoritolerans TaxID=450367 RepID=UPI0024C1A889|nr:hypothetical protein [Peribacillus frigoritolerans]WHX68266.1 hypothetical protein QNH26_06625 [Peribacillus frigoritolerans]